jgi:filamentous hemagglutinin
MSDSAAKVIASLAGGATAAGIGAVASGGSTAGAVTAFNADMNNRQLHPKEAQKAKELAAKSGGKYTQKQIEDALRNASDSATGEDITTGMVIKNPADPNAITDKGAVFNTGGDGKSLVQVLPNAGNVDPELAARIQKDYPNYSWSNEQLGKVSPLKADPNAGLNKITPAANGCVTAECAAGLAPVTKPNDAAAAIGVGTALTGAGAVTGNPVLIGAGVNLLSQGIKSRMVGTNDVSLKEAAISGAMGSLGAAATEIQAVRTIIQQGGVAATATNATIGAGTNVIGDTATKVVKGEEITVKGVAGNLATGALGGVVLPKNPVVPAAATEVLNALKEKVLQGEDK